MPNSKLNKITRKTNNSKNKTVMKIPNINFLRTVNWIQIWWMKNQCSNLTNSRSKMSLTDFSLNQVFKDLNTWKVFNSYLKLNFRSKSKNSKLNLKRDRSKCWTSKMKEKCNLRVLVKKVMKHQLRTSFLKNKTIKKIRMIKLPKIKTFHKLFRLRNLKIMQWLIHLQNS